MRLGVTLAGFGILAAIGAGCVAAAAAELVQQLVAGLAGAAGRQLTGGHPR